MIAIVAVVSFVIGAAAMLLAVLLVVRKRMNEEDRRHISAVRQNQRLGMTPKWWDLALGEKARYRIKTAPVQAVSISADREP